VLTRWSDETGIGVDSLAVVSWNTHVGGADIAGLVEDLRGGSLTGAPVTHFVLLLQEVHRTGSEVPHDTLGNAPRRIESRPPGGARLDIVETAHRLGLDLYYVPSMANGRAATAGTAEDRGNAILSTLPLGALAAIELPYEAQRRVAVAATVQGTTADGRLWRLRVASVHLDHRSRWSRLLATFGPGRRRQAGALAAALESDGPAAVGGDLNTWSLAPLEGALPLLQRSFPSPMRGSDPTFAAVGGVRWRLDHLLFRLPDGQPARARRLDDRRGSDHHPLLGWVRFISP
jgi:endonuclease/exonuclease/phosphatase family metal-dependent hydrolase